MSTPSDRQSSTGFGRRAEPGGPLDGYWDKGVFIDWDPRDSGAIDGIVDAAVGVFPQDTMKRLRALKQKHDPHNVFKMGAWQYEANK